MLIYACGSVRREPQALSGLNMNELAYISQNVGINTHIYVNANIRRYACDVYLGMCQIRMATLYLSALILHACMAH